MADVGISIKLDGLTAATTGLDKVGVSATKAGTSAQNASRGFTSLERSMGQLKAALIGVGVGRLVGEFSRLADTMTNMRSRITLVTGSLDKASAAQATLLKLANRTRVDFEGVGVLYSRIGRSADELGLSQERLIGFTETFSQALKISGASTAEAQSTVLQLSQALASGRLQGAELNAILEAGGRAATALAAGLNVPIGSLKKLGEQGELTSQRVIAAIESQSGVIAKEFSGMEVTVADSYTVFQNNLLEFADKMNKSTALTQKFSAVFESLSRLMKDPEFVNSIVAIAGAVGTVSVAIAHMVDWLGKSIQGWQMMGKAAADSMPYKMLKFKLTGQVDTPTPEMTSEQKNSKGKHSNHGQTFDFSERKNKAAFDLSGMVGGDDKSAAKAAKEAMRAEKDAINALIDSDERLAALQQSLWEESRALVEAAWKPLQNYSSELDHLNILFATGNMKVDEYNSVIDGLNIKLAETNATVGAFETALDGIFEQAISGGDDFEKQLRSIGKTLATDIFKENVFNPLKDAGKGLVGSLFGGGKAKSEPASAMDLLGGGSGDVSSVFDNFLSGLDGIFGQGDKGFLGGLTELFTGDKGVISGFGSILSESWTFLSGLFTSFLTEMGIMQAWEIAEKWALAIWDTAERWAIAIFEAAAGFLGFETGGEITVTRPTLFVAGEKNKAEHIRVSPLSGGSRGESRGGRGGFASMAEAGSGGGVTNVQVFIPQTSVISGLTEGSFARKITNAVGRQRARTV